MTKASEAYKLGDTNVEVVLRVANYWKDVQLSMLSDDYFEEVIMFSAMHNVYKEQVSCLCLTYENVMPVSL